jgi:TRAP-type C4-dicarboxylate transport system permease small subunit
VMRETNARVTDALDAAGGGIESMLGLALIAAVALNVVNVINRYVLGFSITGADEFQIYLMVAMAYLGSAVASARAVHLRMDVLTRYFPKCVNAGLRSAEAILTVCLCGFVATVSARYALRMYELDSHSENAGVPMWIPHSLLVVAFCFMTLIGLLRLWPARGFFVPSPLQKATP